MSLFCASFVIGHCAVNICEWNWSCSVCSQNSSALTCPVLVIHCSVRNFLTTRHVLIITAFCIRLYRAGWRVSSFEVLCKLFGIIHFVHSATGIIYTVFSCHVLISTAFISYHHNCHYYFGFCICTIFVFRVVSL